MEDASPRQSNLSLYKEKPRAWLMLERMVSEPDRPYLKLAGLLIGCGCREGAVEDQGNKKKSLLLCRTMVVLGLHGLVALPWCSWSCFLW